MKLRVFTSACILLILPLAPLAAESGEFELVNRQAIDRVWAGNVAGFDFLTQGNHQYIAYYDANRQMSVAYRRGPRSPWTYYKVDSWLGWDSHNNIKMALDADGHLHLSGNMHGHRIEYFRTRYAHDVRSLKRVEVMANREMEKRVTYPRFLQNKNGDLLFKYRIGGSGNGSDIYLRYDTESRDWSQLHAGPLIDGEGKMNAYVDGPAPGPDGRFHMVWIWRDTGDAATNHDISYARSPDLVEWQDSAGKRIQIPITFNKSDIVDPVPPGGGAINNNVKLGFDSQNRPLVAFHKFDENGNTQVYLSRREDAGWASYPITDWEDFRWSFSGFGALPDWKVRVGRPELLPDGNILLPIGREGKGAIYVLDGDSLEHIDTRDAPPPFPEVVAEVASSKKALNQDRLSAGNRPIFRTRSTGGFNDSPDEQFFISWEAQVPFRDQAREAIPPPSTLILHRLKKSGAAH